MDKPVTLVISEFKEKFAGLLNESSLPAWLLIMLIEPFMSQLRQLADLQEKEASDQYNKTLEENTNERDDDSKSVSD